MHDYRTLPYRIGALAMVFDEDDNILVVQLQDYGHDEWGFPGGGREDGETGEQNALRELTEELGAPAADFTVLAKSNVTYRYDFPDEMREKQLPVALHYRGQQKDQYFIRFTGDKAAITINTDELRAHKWIPASSLKTHLLFPHQYELAERSLAEYQALQAGQHGPAR